MAKVKTPTKKITVKSPPKVKLEVKTEKTEPLVKAPCLPDRQAVLEHVEQHIQRRFSPLVITFGFIVVLIAVVVGYLAFSNTVVTIITKALPTTYPFSYTADQLDALSVSTTVTDHEYSYDQLSKTNAQPAIARGTVTIYNHYSTDQPLVRTTRLLSKEGVLFRTDKTVVVPAGGKVDVQVYADQAGESGNIPPSKFEIVALWAGLKDKIYAESSSAMSGGVIYASVVTDEDVTKARTAAEQQVREQAVTNLQQSAQTRLADLTPAAVALEITSQVITPALGATTDHITVRTTANASALAFSADKLTNLLEQQYQQTVPLAKVTYAVTVQDNQGMVSGSVELLVKVTKPDFVDKTKLTNKTKDQMISYLKELPEVESAEVKFAPFWLTAVPPQWSNKITITIK